MLKLEKHARSTDITISLLDRERFLNRSMLQALFIAIALHFSAAQLFNIRLFYFNEEKGILPSTVVESSLEHSEQGKAISAYIEEERIPLKSILEPSGSIPTTPILPFSKLERDLQTSLELNSKKNPFIALEQEIHYSSIEHRPFPLHNSPIKVRLSGDIASEGLINDGTQKILISDLQYIVPEKISLHYKVQVEGIFGRIFWFELSSPPSTSNVLMEVAEKILNQIQFKTNSNIFIQKGEIELLFNLIKFSSVNQDSLIN